MYRSSETIYAKRVFSRIITDKYDHKPRKIIATFELHQLGNQKAYFSITGEIWRWSSKLSKTIGDDCEMAGCIHDEIAKYFDVTLKPFLNLHLSDIDGMQMHSFDNGLFWLGIGSAYASREPLEKRKAILADHWRIDGQTVDRLFGIVEWIKFGRYHRPDDYSLAQSMLLDYLREFHDSQIARWQDEARKAIDFLMLAPTEKSRGVNGLAWF